MALEEALQRIAELEKELAQAKQTIVFLLNRISELEKRLSKDSHNSHKPPSTDGLKRKKRKRSLRKKSGKKPGGQKGHPGHHLKSVAKPDTIIPLNVANCSHCGQDLSGVEGKDGEHRQVFELPKIRHVVIEYRSEEKTCPFCLEVTRGVFPDGVNSPVQYGPGVKAAVVYLQQGQFLSFERTSQTMADLFELPISEGMLMTCLEEGYDRLGPAADSIKTEIQGAPIVHSDETGMRVKETLQWIHSASTKTSTLYALHPKRGKEGMDAMGVLSKVQGRAIHDGWKSYFDYDNLLHGLCNAHHLRELISVVETENAPWAQPMIDFLLMVKIEKEARVEAGFHAFSRDNILEFELAYEKLLSEGCTYYSTRLPPPSKTEGKRGRKKQWPGKNLLDRLKEHRASVLAFMYDFNVPFDNNLAERDIRMCKLRQKISGEFRTEKGAKIFCRIRSVFSTAKKRSINIFYLLQRVFNGCPANLCLNSP